MSEKQNSGDTGSPAAPTRYQDEVSRLEADSATAARLFDVRRIIGGLFVVYGLIVTGAGINASDADLKKAQDININLWTGLAMLALGLAFLAWMRLRPAVAPEGTPADAGDAAGAGGAGAGGPKNAE